MESMQSRKIPISELRAVVSELALLEPDLLVSSKIDFDLLSLLRTISMKRAFHESA